MTGGEISEVVERSRKVDSESEEVEGKGDPVWWPADNVTAAYHQRRDDSVASRRVKYWTTRLNNNN